MKVVLYTGKTFTFKKKTMSINHTLEIKNKDKWIRKHGTKTKNGVRIISLDNDTVEILKTCKKRQSEKKSI